MIAVTVLTLAVAGPLYTASRAVVASQIAKDQLTASYLAQEGIEFVRQMRDDEYLQAYKAGGSNVSGAAWTAFVSGGDQHSISGCKSTACMLDPYPTNQMGTGSGLTLQPCSGGACTPLYLANGLYTEKNNLSGALQTPYTRTVQAFDVGATEEKIVSTVTWTFHGTPYTVTVSDHLTPWQ